MVNKILRSKQKTQKRKSVLGMQPDKNNSESSLDCMLVGASVETAPSGERLEGKSVGPNGAKKTSIREASSFSPGRSPMQRTGSMLSMKIVAAKDVLKSTFKKRKQVAPDNNSGIMTVSEKKRDTRRSSKLLDKEAAAAVAKVHMSERARRLSGHIHSVGNFGLDFADKMKEQADRDNPYIIRYNSKFKRRWDMSVILMVIWNLYFIPLHAAFYYENPDDIDSGMRLIDDFMDVLFIVDVVINFRSTFVDEKGNEIFNSLAIRKHYMKTWFAIDVLAAFPFDIVYGWIMGGTQQSKLGVLAILKCFRLLRLGKMLKYVEYFLNANAVRILKLIFGVFLLAHWTTCSWYLLNHLEVGNTWLYERGLVGGTNVSEMYIETLYSVFLMLFRNMDIHPVTTAENAFAIVVILLGAVMYATIFGSIAVVIANFDAGNASFHQKKLSILDRMRFLRLPKEIQDKVLRFYDCLWTLQKCTDGSHANFISELSPSLATEVLQCMHLDTLKKVPFFSEFSEIVVNEICFKLKAQVYLDGDYIVREGDFGDWMGFITRGKVKISSSDGIDVELQESHYFGEMSLLFSTRRTASVIALVYCVITQLTAKDFEDIREKFPEHGKHMERVMEAYFYGLDGDSPSPSGSGSRFLQEGSSKLPHVGSAHGIDLTPSPSSLGSLRKLSLVSKT